MSDLTAEAQAFRTEHNFDQLDPNTQGEQRQELTRQFIGYEDDWKLIAPFTNKFLACILQSMHKKGLGNSDVVAMMRQTIAQSTDVVLRARAFYGLDVTEGWFERYMDLVENQYAEIIEQQRGSRKPIKPIKEEWADQLGADPEATQSAPDA